MELEQSLKIFALNSTWEFGQRVAEELGITLSDHEERDFEDGEHKVRSLESVRNCDVFVIQSIYEDERRSVNDKLCRLLFFIGSLHDAGASTVTAVVPYLCYMRKDRKTKPRDPVTTRYIARLFEAMDIHRIVTMDVHNLQAYQNGFRCYTDHLEAQKLFVDYFSSILDGEEVSVMSPDAGGAKRAEQFRKRMEDRLQRSVPLAFMEKQRSKGVVSGDTVVGDVSGKSVIIIDDLISSGTTMGRAAKACKEMGAHKVYAAATHAAFVGKASLTLGKSALDGVVVTDTIPPSVRLPEEFRKRKVEVLNAAPLFAEAISRLHRGGSLVDLMEPLDL